MKIYLLVCISILAAAGIWGIHGNADAAEIERISPEAARVEVQSGRALLVCAYDDDACRPALLEGAILRSELESRLPDLEKDRTIIFYCG